MSKTNNKGTRNAPVNVTLVFLLVRLKTSCPIKIQMLYFQIESDGFL